jgi:hypothetical protein
MADSYAVKPQSMLLMAPGSGAFRAVLHRLAAERAEADGMLQDALAPIFQNGSRYRALSQAAASRPAGGLGALFRQRARTHQPIVTSQRAKQLPNHLLVNESSLSTQGIGGSCGR